MACSWGEAFKSPNWWFQVAAGTAGGFSGLAVKGGVRTTATTQVGAEIVPTVLLTNTVGKFWNTIKNFRGVKVFQRSDIFDPKLMTTWKEGGKIISGTNKQRMATGRAPIGRDGKSVNLHHLTQRNDSGIAEMTQTFHQSNSGIIHINPNTIPSGINRSQFKTWKENYWKDRALGF